MATSKRGTTPSEGDPQEERASAPPSKARSSARERFLAGEITWREYVEQEQA
jgi:hypothetical protein